MKQLKEGGRERRAKKEYIPIIVKLLETDKEELLTLWFVDEVTVVVAAEKELSNNVLDIAKQNINNI